MHLLRAFVPYLLAVAAAMAVAEAAVRVSTFDPAPWYPQVIARTGGAPVRFLFVGTSRVGAGVNVEQFAAAVPADAALEARPTFNMGLGFSTLAEHALGLGRMADAGMLHGAVVFVEAAGGVPDTSTWRDRWFQTESPGLLLSVMRPRDLPGLWRSEMDVDHKLAASARVLLRPSWLATYRENIRVQGLTAVYARSAAVMRGTPAAAPDMRAEGGVRGDIDDRARIRAAAGQEGRRQAATARRVDDWNALILADIVTRVRAAGGEVAFFDMPLSGPMRVASESETGRANAESFRRQVKQWGTRLVPAKRRLPDEAFPDLWHMSAAAADMFTRDLIGTWLASSALPETP